MLAYRTHCAAMSFFFKSQGSSWSHRFTEFIHAKFSTGISGDLLAQDPLHFLFNIFSRTRKILVRTDSQILYLFFDPRSQVQAICWPGTNCNDYPHQIQIQTQVQIKIKIQICCTTRLTYPWVYMPMCGSCEVQGKSLIALQRCNV